MENNNSQKKRRNRIYKNSQRTAKVRIIIGLLSSGLVILLAFGVYRLFFNNNLDPKGKNQSSSTANETELVQGSDKQNESSSTSDSKMVLAASDSSDSSTDETTVSNEASSTGKSNSETEESSLSETGSETDDLSSQQTLDQEKENESPALETDQEFEDIYSSLDQREKICGLLITSPEQFDMPGETTISLDDNIKGNLKKSPVCGLALGGKNVSYYDQFHGLISDLSSFDDSLPMDMFLMMLGETKDSWFPYLQQNLYYQEDTTLGVLDAYGINLYYISEQEEDIDYDGFRNQKIVVCTKDYSSQYEKKNNKNGGSDLSSEGVMIMLSSNGKNGKNKPSCMSKDAVSQVKDTYGDNTVIITDVMNRDSITRNYSTGEAVVNALKAGVDIILMPEDFEEAVDAIGKAIDDNVLPEERIKESLYRIYKIKKEMK